MKKLFAFAICLILSASCVKKNSDSVSPIVNKKEFRDTGSDLYRSVKTGLFSDTSVWEKKVSGVWVDAHNTPGQGNSIVLQATYTVTLDSNYEVTDINVNSDEDVVRLNLNGFTLDCYGVFTLFIGDFANQIYGINAPASETIFTYLFSTNGKIRFTGYSRDVILTGKFGANRRQAGLHVVFDMGSNTAGIKQNVRFGRMDVVSGTVDCWDLSDIRIGLMILVM